jgi:NADPH:quinone reductase
MVHRLRNLLCYNQDNSSFNKHRSSASQWLQLKGSNMRAMVLPRFRGSNLFEMHELERPEPGCGEVLVRVVASAVNPVDAKLRANGGSAQLDPPVILGYDVAGIVEEIGPGISDFKIGDEVYYTPEIFGNPHGSYAEYNVTSAAIVARKPTGLSFVDASAIPLAGGTAWEAVIRRLAIRPGETILIHGSAGGSGRLLCNLPKPQGRE